MPLGHGSERRTQAVEVIGLITAVTHDDLIIVHVTETTPAEA
jgi:hypothetical protein